jgi:hypothetical protein
MPDELTMPQKIEEGGKHCPNCQTMKPLSRFHKCKGRYDGVQGVCKKCSTIYAQSSRLRHTEKRDKYLHEWYLKNKEKYQKRGRENYLQNKEYHREKTYRWMRENPEQLRAIGRKAKAKLLLTTRGRLDQRISSAIKSRLQGKVKGGRSWGTLVEFTVNDLQKHLEKKFVAGMSWENMGEWHLDHKIPRSVFNYNSPEDIDFSRCWALSNLQPLWKTDNISKSNRLDKPFQPSLALRVA